MKTTQRLLDTFWNKTLLPCIPSFVMPDHLSMVRLLMIPVIVWLFVINQLDIVFWLTVVLILTDSLDGALARKRNQFSKWGALLDPIADKLLVILLLLLLMFVFDQTALLLSVIIIEFVIIAGGLVFGWLFGKESIASAVLLSKIKAVCQFFGILAALLYVLLYGSFWYDAATVLFATSVLLGVINIAHFFAYIVKFVSQQR